MSNFGIPTGGVSFYSRVGSRSRDVSSDDRSVTSQNTLDLDHPQILRSPPQIVDLYRYR